MDKPTVFISYSHDNPEHAARVRALGASLSRDGCACRLDVHKDTDEDWPLWMKRQLIEADFVFCVITQTYERRFDDEELPDVGQGVGWEAGLIRRLLSQISSATIASSPCSSTIRSAGTSPSSSRGTTISFSTVNRATRPCCARR